MSEELRLEVLGGLRVTLDGVQVTHFVSNKAPALLAYLAVTGRQHFRSALAGLLWSEHSEEDARRNLRVVLTNLRQQLAPYLVLTRDTIAFDRSSAYHLDVQLFEAALEGRLAPDVERLRSAVALYKGDFLEGFYVRNAPLFDEWVTAQRERLRQLALHALHELVDYHTAQGEYAAGIDACTRLLQFDPWREDAHRQLMLLLALSGQRSAALAQYDICRRVLDEELGDEPSEETTALRERILADEFAGQHEAALSQAAGTPQTPVRPPVYQLPVPPTPLVGRMTGLIQASAQLLNPTCRLLTLLGPGGVGKTRLALEVAHTCAATDDRPSPFVHGVYFVPLAALAAPDAVDDVLATTIASVLQIPLSGPETAAIQVLQYLRGKAVLLVLDNFEHLMAGASFVSSLLQSAPSLKILVTSRERLNVRGERVVELDGLAFPLQQRLASVSALEQFSAIQLFVQTAQSTTPNFVLTEETTSAVLRICQLVGGLPLAIELAATWTRMLTCSEIADELAQNLDFLNSATPDLPPRQQSLRAVFASSWGLLAPPEQHVLQQLSIFQGSFARAAATAVTGASLPALAALVDKTLVRRANSENSRETRYELLAVLRQYAAEHLEATGETAATASRHATYYLALLAGLAADLRGRGQQAALKQISGEIDDVRAAWRWAVTQQDHRAMARAADSLFHFYYMRSWFAEGAAVFEMAAQALAMHRTDNDVALVWGKVLARQGWFVFHLGRQREARTLLEQSLAVLRSLDARAEMVFALNYLAAICSFLGEYQSTRTLAEESLKLTEASDDQYGRVVACNILGQMSYDLGEYAAAQAWGQQSLTIERQMGNRWSMAFSLMTLGKVTYALHAYRDARQLFEQSLRIREELGDIRGAALCFNWLGDTAVAMHEHAEAGQRYRQSLAWFQEIGNQWGIAASLLNLGQLAIKQVQYAAAARMLGHGLRLALEIQALPQVLTILSVCVDLLRSRGEPAWAAELEQIVTSRSATLAAVQSPAQRLLASSDRVAADLTLEQAIAAIEHQAPILDADRRTMGEQSEAQNPKSKIQYTAGLTAREVEVLRLVAQGLTDKEVAEQLIVSPRTVTTHLTAIYGKLQINSRSAATRFAVDHDLV